MLLIFILTAGKTFVCKLGHMWVSWEELKYSKEAGLCLEPIMKSGVWVEFVQNCKVAK